MLKIGKNISSDWTIHTCQPKTKDELKEIILDRISKEGPNCDLNDIDTSLIEDMQMLFAYSKFNGNISKWNVSNVKDMIGMFAYSEFNKDISEWDTSNVVDMQYMFNNAKFNQDISRWKINKNCDMFGMFSNCPIKRSFKLTILR